MPNHSLSQTTRALLSTILKAGGFIDAWTVEMNEHAFWEDKRTRAAVERQFEIIAEALRRLQTDDAETLKALTDPEAAIRLGDAIRGDYDAIDYGILWRATRKELPAMMGEVHGLLGGNAFR